MYENEKLIEIYFSKKKRREGLRKDKCVQQFSVSYFSGKGFWFLELTSVSGDTQLHCFPDILRQRTKNRNTVYCVLMKEFLDMLRQEQ